MLNTSKNYELNILVGGKPVSEYEHKGNVFIEGRKGSEFEVEFKNKTNKQVLVVPSVDGKSIFDGKPATPDSQGYIIRPWGSIRIPGWTLDAKNVARFTFEDKEKSYSAAVTQEGEPVVSGVIGAMVYAEKPKPQTINHVHHYYPGTPRTPWPSYPHWPNTGPMLMGTGMSDSKGVTRGASMRADSATLSASATASAASSHENTAASDPFEMGAGFGKQTAFATRAETFERGNIEDTLQLYYDSRRNLEKRGIQVVKKETRYLDELPQAFSGTGCKPPAGWQG